MTPEELKASIIPKSDQLNADDLLCGPITTTVRNVKKGDKEQPVSIEIEGHMPYKPCKSMRRVLIAAWGDKGADWVGKSMTLYCDPNVAFGGVKVGGIRISHLSHIDSDRVFMLTHSRGKKGEFHVKRLAEKPADDAVHAIISSFDRLGDDATDKDYASVRAKCKGMSPEQMQLVKPHAEAAKLRIEGVKVLTPEQMSEFAAKRAQYTQDIHNASSEDLPALKATVGEMTPLLQAALMPVLRAREVFLTNPTGGAA